MKAVLSIAHISMMPLAFAQTSPADVSTFECQSQFLQTKYQVVVDSRQKIASLYIKKNESSDVKIVAAEVFQRSSLLMVRERDQRVIDWTVEPGCFSAALNTIEIQISQSPKEKSELIAVDSVFFNPFLTNGECPSPQPAEPKRFEVFCRKL